jgi:DNA-binding NarL/FixJ family response regulator
MVVGQTPTDAVATPANNPALLSDGGDDMPAGAHDAADMTRLMQVFLIEDSAEIREALTQTLESAGRMVVSGYADSAAGAIEALDTQDIDAVIIDLHLREGSGLQVLAHLEQTGNPKHLLRIVLTNHTAPMFKRSCEKLGAEYFLDKSLEFERAVEILAEHAARLV